MSGLMVLGRMDTVKLSLTMLKVRSSPSSLGHACFINRISLRVVNFIWYDRYRKVKAAHTRKKFRVKNLMFSSISFEKTISFDYVIFSLSFVSVM